ncbi:hypothetical protein ACPV5W_18155 [Vibrio astriarenae]
MKAIVISGFHRSATSATTHYLKNSGLDIGSELSGGNVSNINGHYEDKPIKDLHEQQLLLSNTSWQFHDETSIKPQSRFLVNYVDERSLRNQVWGVKDPRACLFLYEWEQQLGDAGCYLFIARHWSSCIESLLHRHSRELAYSLVSVDAENMHGQFWVQPALAAKMWLAYSRRILDFVQNKPEKVLLVTQRGLFEGAPLISALNNKFGLQLDENAECPYDASQLNDHACQTVVDGLSESLKAQLESVWHQLLSLAHYKSKNEQPNIYSESKIESSFVKEYYSKVSDSKDLFTLVVPDAKPDIIDTPKLEGTSEEEVLLWVKGIALQPRDDVQHKQSQLNQIKQQVIKQFPLSIDLLVELGQHYQKIECYEQAIANYQHAVSIGKVRPYVFMLLGQCYQRLSDYDLALHFFNKALGNNARNPVFYRVKAELFSSLGQNDSAIECFDTGINLLGHLPALVGPYSQLLLQQEKPDKACQLLAQSDLSNPTIARRNAQAQMQLDVQKGLATYYQLIAQQIKSKNKIQWLLSATRYISDANAEMDFVNRCVKHWEKLETE